MNALAKPSSLLQRTLRDWFSPEALDRDLLEMQTSLFPSRLAGNIPSVNIRETPKEFILDVAAPGLQRTDFKLEVEDNNLTISSEKEEEKEQEDGYMRKEYSYGPFSRCFALPDNIKEGGIDAKYENGILTVTIPKEEVTRTKQVKTISVQ